MTRPGSVHTAFERTRSALDPALISGSALSALSGLAARFPELGAAQYIECRLGQPTAAPVDLLISVTKFQRETLARGLTDPAMKGSGMLGFNRLLDQWNRGGTTLHESVPVAWIEFDDAERQHAPAANVCVSVVPSYIDPFAPLTSQAVPELLALLYESVGVIRGTPCSDAEERALRRSVEMLPSGAHWIHLSVMSARKPGQLKLYGYFPVGTLLKYLEDVRWLGDVASVGRLVSRYYTPDLTGASVYVDLPVSDLIPGATTGLGLCFSQQQVRQSTPNDPARRVLLGRLHEDGLCTTRERDALAAWPSCVELTLEGAATRIERWLDIKLVHRAEQPPLAKAYLGFSEGPPRGEFSQVV